MVNELNMLEIPIEFRVEFSPNLLEGYKDVFIKYFVQDQYQLERMNDFSYLCRRAWLYYIIKKNLWSYHKTTLKLSQTPQLAPWKLGSGSDSRFEKL